MENRILKVAEDGGERVIACHRPGEHFLANPARPIALTQGPQRQSHGVSLRPAGMIMAADHRPDYRMDNAYN